MTEDEYLLSIQNKAKEYDVLVTKNAINIARFRTRTQLPMEKCPCCPLDKERGCISKKCLEEINTLGKCHCQCYERK